MNKGWIKLYRKFLDWEWIQEPNVVHLFVHLLLRVNYEEKKWRGITIKKGQIVTGLYSLQEMTGLSIRSIRTALEKLESTGEITRKTTNRFSIITVINWAKYQEDKKYRQTNDKQTTTTKEYKESKEDIIAKAIEEKLPVNNNKMYTYEEVDDDGNRIKVGPRGGKRVLRNDPFDQEKEIDRMMKAPQKFYAFIGLEIAFKELKFKNHEQLENFKAQEVKHAQKLKGYTIDEVMEAMEYTDKKAKDGDFKWNLATVGKYISEVINK